ncbi:hypothetical protein MSPP1_001460 [Malassezia sp. CBS 17886]|nr:hypothetical protein MSPP1_001460 [Malassezia sp. CBS 17886]
MDTPGGAPGCKAGLRQDGTVAVVSVVVCVGIVVSYVPQLWRIARAKSSVGISPWFLFLGATSSMSTTANVFILQWGAVQCCGELPLQTCLQRIQGFLQVTLQWFMFSLVCLAYLAYYTVPQLPYLRRERGCRRQARRRGAARDAAASALLRPDAADEGDSSGSDSDLDATHEHITRTYSAMDDHTVDVRSQETHAEHDHRSYLENVPQAMRAILEQHHAADADIHGKMGSPAEWRLSRTLAWLAFAHLVSVASYSAFALLTHQPRYVITRWAKVLGISGAVLSALQYLPQIVSTARARLVRSISILGMAIQIPGSLLFMYVLAVQEGTDWSSLLAYAVAFVLQGTLLALCLAWKAREARLHIDDYGRPLAH